MAVLVFCVGCIALILGAIVAVYGIPVREFSFGNTLIIIGITTATGGLIIIALSAVISQLQQIVAAIATQDDVGSAKLNDAPTDRMRSPSKPGSFRREAFNSEPAQTMRPVSVTAADSAMEARASEPLRPTLANPERPRGASVERANFERERERSAEPRAEGRSHTNRRDFTREMPRDTGRDLGRDMSRDMVREPASDLPESASAVPQTAMRGDERREVAVLKSGVLDGMGYTLYVDGSIEAELPQGTLRFASINELRSHLEKNV